MEMEASLGNKSYLPKNLERLPFTMTSSRRIASASHTVMNAVIWQKLHTACGNVYSNSLRAFTRHPAETKETYMEHLWFTVHMSLRLTALGILLFTHGVFPFLFTRTASAQFESIYLIMRGRIPLSRRAQMESEYEI